MTLDLMAPMISGQVKDDKSPGNHTKIMFFIGCRWHELCLATFQSAVKDEHVRDILATANDQDQADEILGIHFQFAISTVKRFWEFALLYQSFPWRFAMLLNPSTRDQTLLEMKEEWEFLLSLESKHAANLKKYPYSLLPHVKWCAYREIMTFADERGFGWGPELEKLILSWLPDPISTLGADEAFRQMRKAEREATMTGSTSPVQLQSVGIKAMQSRYQNFEGASLGPRDYSGISPGSFVKRSVFDSSRATASETKVPCFNNMARIDTISPHMLSRKCLNLWHTLKKTGGALDRTYLGVIKSWVLNYLLSTYT